MNVAPSSEGRINPAVWERPDMRRALAARDIITVYRLLQRFGVSQRRIAALTGQAPSEIYEILKGRQVLAYYLLIRIADGLGIPRGYMGLAYDSGTVELLSPAASRRSQPDEREEVRRLLAHAAEITVGAAVLSTAAWWQPVEGEPAPAPTQIGHIDVARLEGITTELCALDRRYGGGACRDAVIAQVRWSQQLLLADCHQDVGHRLHLALADLHNLAGWTSFDVGLYGPARQHFTRALEQAKHAAEPSMVAKALYCLGRLHLHRQWATDALRFFQLGQLAAQESACELTVAMLCANEAWAYAELGDIRQALKSMGRAEDQFIRSDLGSAPTWVRFFGHADVYASAAMVHAISPEQTAKDRQQAVNGFTRSLTNRGPEMARSRAFELTALATVHLQDGDLDEGVRLGHQAADLAEQVRSVRITDRMAPLQAEVARHTHHADVADLAERIATLRAA